MNMVRNKSGLWVPAEPRFQCYTRVNQGTGAGTTAGTGGIAPSAAGGGGGGSGVTTVFSDPLTADTSVTEREPNAAWSYDANGATQPDTGGFNQASLSWGTKNASQLLPDPTSIADGKYTHVVIVEHSVTGEGAGYPIRAVHVYADATLINNVLNSFLAVANGSTIKIYKRVAGSDTELATATTAFDNGDSLALKVTKNGSSWDVSAEKNGTEVCSASAQAHAGTLGRYALFEYQGLSGDTGTWKNAVATTNGA